MRKAPVLIAVSALLFMGAVPVYWLTPVRLPPPKINVYALAADTAETLTVPSFSGDGLPSDREVILVFAPVGGCEFFYRKSGTATVPTADVTDGTGSSRNPAALRMKQDATISLIADEDCIVSVEFHPLRLSQ